MGKIILLQDIQPGDVPQVGGKASSLAQLARNGFTIVDTLCVTCSAYQEYIDAAGLRERILLELYRKEAQDMRWEEVWDSALRIRNMFLSRPLPEDLYQELRTPIKEFFGDRAVVVRSSAPSEDSANASFAGLHESYVNVKGVEAILEHIRLVWASLWIEDQFQRTVNEGRKRLAKRGLQKLDTIAPEEISRALKEPSYIPQAPLRPESSEEQGDFRLKGRQLIGQPAGPGLAKAKARIILRAADLAEFKSGEILVCDAVDPTMTFIVPLAAGIVERRGGMLIHGAIIAREDGLPCVTGVPDVTRLIQSGESITMDGYLGIVTLG